MSISDIANLSDNINRTYFHNPYIARLSCVDIIQFVERFIRFELYLNLKVGFKELREWDRLVRAYVEEVHSFIDLQRKVGKQFEKVFNLSVDEIRQSTVTPQPVDFIIVQEIRRRLHHVDMKITSIPEVQCPNGYYPAIPMVFMSKKWFVDNVVQERVVEVNNNPAILTTLFSNHCRYFINTSNALGQKMISHFNNKSVSGSDFA